MRPPAAPPPPPPSLVERVRPIAAGEHVVAAAFVRERPLLALASGEVLFCEEDEQRVTAHAGGLLLAKADANGLVSGGEDGRIVRVDGKGAVTLLGEAAGWPDSLAIHPDGHVAWGVGKSVTARDAKGRLATLAAPSSARGLAFLPKGYRLAVAHYNGVSLWFPALDAAPDVFGWKGSHLDVTISPDGRFVVSSMQENALHGWRLTDKAHMRMTGYPAKTRSFSWSHDGNWLATSGAEACILWPFAAKDGPMGKAPRECGVRPRRITQVACHPAALVVAMGYEDGWVMLVRLTDAAELLVRVPEAKAAAITALAWDKTGKRLLYGAADGAAGLLALP
jgi:WD40 repeat protein